MVAFPPISGTHPDDGVDHANVTPVREFIPWHQLKTGLHKLQPPADGIPQAKFFS